jgi:hypothetical protein
VDGIAERGLKLSGVEVENVDDCIGVTRCFFLGDGRGGQKLRPLRRKTLLLLAVTIILRSAP